MSGLKATESCAKASVRGNSLCCASGDFGFFYVKRRCTLGELRLGGGVSHRLVCTFQLAPVCDMVALLSRQQIMRCWSCCKLIPRFACSPSCCRAPPCACAVIEHIFDVLPGFYW